MTEINEYRFETELDIGVYRQPANKPSPRWLDWEFVDNGPGIFRFPETDLMGVRAIGIDDTTLRKLVAELEPASGLRYLHLAENRNVTARGLAALAALPMITCLNISACDIDDKGMAFLQNLSQLEWLDISYCNRLSANAARYLQNLNRLRYLNVQGIPKINTGARKKFEKKNLEIYSG
ncbi:MAG: hypothetical protein GX933_09880 [Chloroflexi bacterium]|nr:hypothetical protein [Chloroflexota bacterium]